MARNAIEGDRHGDFDALPVERQETIMRASIEGFGRHDYKGASTEEIARRAGMSKGLLFFYFRNKGSLYVRTLDYLMERAVDWVVDDEFRAIDDFFDLLEYAGAQKLALMGRWPWVFEFSLRAFYADHRDIRETVAKWMTRQVDILYDHGERRLHTVPRRGGPARGAGHAHHDGRRLFAPAPLQPRAHRRGRFPGRLPPVVRHHAPLGLQAGISGWKRWGPEAHFVGASSRSPVGPGLPALRDSSASFGDEGDQEVAPTDAEVAPTGAAATPYRLKSRRQKRATPRANRAAATTPRTTAPATAPPSAAARP